MRFIFLLALNLFTFLSVFASQDRIDLEWDPVEGAISYEIELKLKTESEERLVGIFQAEKAQWIKAVNPGQYLIRIRSIDKRGISGKWSDNIDVVVNLSKILKVRPQPDETIVASEIGENEVFFQWEAPDNVQYYSFSLLDDKSNVLENQIVQGKFLKVKIKAGAKYQWSVEGLFKKDDQVIHKNYSFFVLQSFGLLTPVVEGTSERQSIEFRWSRAEKDSTQYEFVIEKQVSEKWIPVIKPKVIKDYNYKVPLKNLKNGSYRFKISELRDYFRRSDYGILSFDWDSKEAVVQDLKKPDYSYRKTYSLEKWKMSARLGGANTSFEGEYGVKGTSVKTNLNGFSLQLSAWRKFYWTDLHLRGAVRRIELVDLDYTLTRFNFLINTYPFKWKKLTIDPYIGFFLGEEVNLFQETSSARFQKNKITYTGLSTPIVINYLLTDWWKLRFDFDPRFSIKASEKIYSLNVENSKSFSTIYSTYYLFSPKLELGMYFEYESFESNYSIENGIFPATTNRNRTMIKNRTYGLDVNYLF